MKPEDLFKSLGEVGAEFMAKLTLIADGNNVVPPSQYVVENEKRWIPNEKTRDVFYDILPSVAELPIPERVALLRALVFSLLTPLEMMDFSDGFAIENVRFLLFLKENPEFKQKFSSEEEKEKVFEKFSKIQAKKQVAKFERENELKELAKKFTENSKEDDGSEY